MKVKCQNCNRVNDTILSDDEGLKCIMCDYCTNKIFFEVEEGQAVEVREQRDMYKDLRDMGTDDSHFDKLKRKAKRKNITVSRTKYKTTGWTLYYN